MLRFPKGRAPWLTARDLVLESVFGVVGCSVLDGCQLWLLGESLDPRDRAVLFT
jgi:hypothetical protein